MDYEISGKVRCNKVSKSRAIRSYVQKQIKKWLDTQNPIAGKGRAFFDVKFEKEGAGNLIGCRLTIRAGNTTWVAYSCTEGFQKAFLESLQRLAPHWNGAVATS